MRLSAELLGLLPVWRSSPVQALARLHSRGRDAAAATPSAVPARRAPTGCTSSATCSATHRAPALAVAALVHAELAHAAAFGTADGVVARAAERLVLVDRGVDPASVTVPEAGHAADPAAYRAALAAYGGGGRRGHDLAAVRRGGLHGARRRRRCPEHRRVTADMRTASPRGDAVRWHGAAGYQACIRSPSSRVCPDGDCPVGRVDRRVGTRCTVWH